MSNWLQTLVMGIAKIHILQISFFLPYETLFYDRTRTKTSQKRPCGWNPAFFGENHLNGGPPWTSPRTTWRGWRKEEAEDLTKLCVLQSPHPTKPEYWYNVLRLSAKASVHFVCPSLTEKTTSVGVVRDLIPSYLAGFFLLEVGFAIMVGWSWNLESS